MTNSESNGRFFYKTNRFESIRITNRIHSNRELEVSRIRQRYTLLQYISRRPDPMQCTNLLSGVHDRHKRL